MFVGHRMQGSPLWGRLLQLTLKRFRSQHVCCLGFTTRPSSYHWVFRFLDTLQFSIDKSKDYWGPQWSIDFLLTSWTDSTPFSSPCSYHHALALVRFYSQCNWLSPPLLSARQASDLFHSQHEDHTTCSNRPILNLESRAKQGHHKKSVQLYTRDDVWPSLFLQRDILIDISTGWRPLTSQARGAKQPLPEPPLVSPPITKFQADLQLVHLSQPKDLRL